VEFNYFFLCPKLIRETQDFYSGVSKKRSKKKGKSIRIRKGLPFTGEHTTLKGEALKETELNRGHPIVTGTKENRMARVPGP